MRRIAHFLLCIGCVAILFIIPVLSPLASTNSSESTNRKVYCNDSNGMTRAEVTAILKSKLTEVEASNILDQYDKNDISSLKKKYDNVHIKLEGKVAKIVNEKDATGMIVYLENEKEDTSSAISCSFDSKKHEPEVKGLKLGYFAIIEGVGEVGTDHYTVEHCQSITNLTSPSKSTKTKKKSSNKQSSSSNPSQTNNKKTSSRESTQQNENEIPYDVEIYNKSNIKVTLTSIEIEPFLGSVFDYKLNFKIENNSKHNIYLTADNVTANGYTVDSMMYESVPAKAKAKSDITIYNSDIEHTEDSFLGGFGFDVLIENAESFETIAHFRCRFGNEAD